MLPTEIDIIHNRQQRLRQQVGAVGQLDERQAVQAATRSPAAAHPTAALVPPAPVSSRAASG